MNEALKLLVTALQLIILAQGPKIPDSIKQQAISTAKIAIQVANQAIKDNDQSCKLGIVASSTVVYVPTPVPIPLPVPVPAPVPIPTPSPSLSLPLAKELILTYATSVPVGFINITAKYLEYGQLVLPMQISFFTLDDQKTFRISKNELNINSPCGGGLQYYVELLGTTRTSCTSDGKIEYSYLSKQPGIYIFEITAKDVNKRITIEVK